MTSIADVEARIAQEIPKLLREAGVLPGGYRCAVRLHGEVKDKKRSANFDNSWNPDTDSIRITFEFVQEELEIAVEKLAVAPIRTPKLGPMVDPLSDILRALDRAEGRPGYEFVSLKWFRDTALLHEAFPWAADEATRHDVLREAIDRRWILTSKVANPRPPNFPVTAIRLNRQIPEVNAALGHRGGGLPAFRPVPIRGESLSATVLRDRR